MEVLYGYLVKFFAEVECKVGSGFEKHWPIKIEAWRFRIRT